MNVGKYLQRIGVDRSQVSIDATGLSLLQRQHLLTAPFENLDIHWNTPIILDIDRFYQKIVENRRGGFCYELNGLFNVLLRNLGFRTRLISARVFNGTVHGPEYDHAAIIVTIGDDEYLTDVGFGDFTAEPLRFVLDEEQADATGTFTIRQFGNDYFEVAKREAGEWKSQYILKPQERNLSEFAEMCDFQQYSPDSHFTKGKICSLMTESGRKSLSDSKFIVTVRCGKTESTIESETEFYSLLQSEFSIVPPV